MMSASNRACIYILPFFLMACANKPAELQGPSTETGTVQPCPSDPAAAQALANGILASAQGDHLGISCLGGDAGMCVEYNGLEYKITGSSIDASMMTRKYNYAVGAALEMKTRQQTSFALSCFSSNRASLDLTGVRQNFKTALNPAAVNYMNAMRTCGINNWVIGVERACADDTADGDAILLGNPDGKILASPVTQKATLVPASISYIKLNNIVTPGTQTDANNLFALMPGSYHQATVCTGYSGNVCVSQMSQDVTISSTSITIASESMSCYVDSAKVARCYRQRHTVAQPILGVTYYSGTAVQAHLGAATHTLAALDQVTADYFNDNMVCQTFMAVGADTPCVVGTVVPPNYRLISVQSGKFLASSVTGEAIPLGSDIALIGLDMAVTLANP